MSNPQNQQPNQPNEESGLAAFADAMGCLLPILLVVMCFVGLPMIFVQWVKEENTKLEAKKETIEGVVSKVESYLVEPPEPVKTDEEKEREKRTTRIIIGPGHIRERFKVTFVDGRQKEFYGVLSKPMTEGKYYVITYNGLNRVEKVELIKDDK